MRRALNQRGFSPVVGFIAVTIVVIIGLIGYIVYHHHHPSGQTDAPNTAPALQYGSATQSSGQASSKPIDPSKAIITQYRAGTIYNLQSLTTTEDQRSQGGAVGRYCASLLRDEEKDGSIVVTTDPTIFTDNSGNYSYNQTDKTATLTASCYNITTGNDQTVSAAMRFELEDDNGTWNTINYKVHESSIYER